MRRCGSIYGRMFGIFHPYPPSRHTLIFVHMFAIVVGGGEAMATPLTDRQRQLLEHIATSIRRNGIVPSVREIGQALGMRSPSTVHQHLMALERKGYVKRYGDRMRVLRSEERRVGKECRCRWSRYQ